MPEDAPLDAPPDASLGSARDLGARRAATRRSLSILVVEDEVLVGLALEAVLTDAGHTVLLAQSLEGARALAERLPPLDLAILDLHLPDGSGTELLEELRGLWPGLPVVISTGFGLAASDRAALAQPGGRVVMVKKPWGEAEVLAALARATAPEG